MHTAGTHTAGTHLERFRFLVDGPHYGIPLLQLENSRVWNSKTKWTLMKDSYCLILKLSSTNWRFSAPFIYIHTLVGLGSVTTYKGDFYKLAVRPTWLYSPLQNEETKKNAIVHVNEMCSNNKDKTKNYCIRLIISFIWFPTLFD